MKSRTIFILIVVIASIILPVLSSADDVVIIGNLPPSEKTKLTKRDLRNIFFGQKRRWDDGSKIIVACLKDSKVQKIFLREYLATTPAQYQSTWKALVFTGRRSQPKVLENSQEMLQYIKKTKGAIGYIPKSTHDLKQLSVTIITIGR